MARNRASDSSERSRSTPAPKIDTAVLVVSLLTAFFATVFATLLFLRPESRDRSESAQAASQSEPVAPPVGAPPQSGITAPPVGAPSAENASRDETDREPESAPSLRARLEQLGVKCAAGAHCYPE